MKTIFAASAAFLAVSSLSFADDFSVTTTSGSVNGGNTLANGDTLTITSSGSIVTVGSPAVDGAASDMVVANDGILFALPIVNGISLSGENNVVRNTNAILAGADGIYIFGNHADVASSGQIVSGGNGVFIEGTAGDIDNSGNVFANGGGLISLGTASSISNSGNVVSLTRDGLAITGGNSSVINSGNVGAALDGIYVDGSDNTILNSGTIFAFDDGIDSRGARGNVITNSGTIIALRDGIETDGDDITVNNCGRIVAQSDSFDLNGTNTVLNLFYGSNIEGLLSFDGFSGTLNFGPGINAALSDDGGMPASVTARNGATFTVGNVHYAINSDQFRVTRDRFSNLLPRLNDIALQELGADGAEQGAFGFSAQLSDEAKLWYRLGGSFADRAGTSSSAGFETMAVYLVAGIAIANDTGLYFAYDRSRSELETSFDTVNDSFLGSVYGVAGLAGQEFDWSFTGGYVSADHERKVLNNLITGGIETSQGNSDSFVFSPAIGFSRLLEDNRQVNLDLRYAGVFAEGYSETGITSPLTFSDHQSHTFSATPSLDWAVGEGPVVLTVGTEYRYYRGDKVGVSFSTGSTAFSPSADRFEARGFGRVRFEHETDNGWVLSGNGEFGASTGEQVDFGMALGLKKLF